MLHIVFPRHFKWKQDLAPLSLINRQLMYVHTFFIGLVVLFMGILCILSAHDLLYTPLGKRIALGLGVFWGIRLFFQLFVYSPALWRGKTFELAMHVFFTCLWIFLTAVFFLTYSAPL